ncbi:two-component system sensor histidine kinase DesK [Haloactinopolyspora alba]|uniref:Two-component system sensor histidine kinase DesK n=1 Tax=Haloactinopolyspora alba TaxID=648780 RepID=A0A2P8E2A0_9ACTN|nr:histidine kinase [Haloactinopolyspora alba]PSL03606.1 two-component system sensor histidine kinase DesK [Haloactinopolyspora alba]
MSALSGWWVERSDPQRFDLYTRGTLYALTAFEVLLAALVYAQSLQVRTPGLVAFLGLAAVHAAVGIRVLHGGMDWYLGRRSWPRSAAVVLGLVTVLGWASSVWAFGPIDDDQPPDGSGSAGLGLMLFTCYAVVAFTPRLRTSVLMPIFAGAVVWVAAASVALGYPGGPAFALGFSTALALVSGGSAYRGSVWMLGVVWELDRSRQTQAQLAVAEERLRFARDLHDVLGRNLSVIALKSELAAQLTRRGRDEAEAEMLEVRDVAQESLREVREVVRGYRSADLATELAGARSVLRSAGVDTRVVGDAAALAPGVQPVLGWVTREGTTNVLRHSDASSCVITVTEDAGTATLVMENDGVSAAGGGRDGSGLSGLEERLQHMGGGLETTRPDGGRFRLAAWVPGHAGHADDEEEPS